jgi:hypothetical protein
MKKLLAIFLSLFLIGTFTVVFGYAIFKDSAVLGVSMSIADFDVDDLVLNILEGKPIDSPYLLPEEWSEYGIVEVRSNSTLPINYYMYVTETDGNICPVANIQLEVATELEDAWEEVYNGDLEDIRGNNDRVLLGMSPSAPHSSLYIRQRVQLDSSADSNDEGKPCLWDEVFRAENKKENYKEELIIKRNSLLASFWTLPEIEVQNPKDSSDELEAGKEEKLKWKLKTAVSEEKLVKITVDLYDETGTSLLFNIVDDLYDEDSYKWNVPQELAGDKYLLKVSALDENGLYSEDYSDEAFEIN